jgi:hypothetical protein
MISAGASFVDIPINIVDDAEVEGNETVTLTLADTANYDLGSSTATVTIADNDFEPGPNRIHDIQGAAHKSLLVGQVDRVPGIVTAVVRNGFYLQDPNPDADNATSEGILSSLHPDRRLVSALHYLLVELSVSLFLGVPTVAIYLPLK